MTRTPDADRNRNRKWMKWIGTGNPRGGFQRAGLGIGKVRASGWEDTHAAGVTATKFRGPGVRWRRVARLTLQTALSTLSTTATTTAAATGDVAASGDDSSGQTFEQLVALHEPRVRRLAHRLLGWQNATDAADDIVQDVLLVLLNRLDTFRGDSSLSTWLTRVTINKCRSCQRRQWVREKFFSLHRTPRSSEESGGADERPTRDDTNASVRAAVQSLAPRDREVIVLFYLEELPGTEIARILGISSPAVDTRLHRARQRLKKKLKDLVIE